MLDTKAHIISLIRNDLINNRLISGMNNLGLEADDYLLSLNDLVFELLKLEDTDEIRERFYDLYIHLMSDIVNYNAEDWQSELNELSRKIYNKLIALKDG